MAHGRERTSEKGRRACVLGVVALALVSLASLLWGTAALGTREALKTLALLASGGTADATATLVLLGVRLPRVVAGMCCGAALACAGLLWLAAALWLPGHPVLRQAMAFCLCVIKKQ